MLQTPNTADQINSVIDHLADKLKVPASHLYDVLCHQARVEFTVHCAMFAVFLLLAMPLCYVATRLWIYHNRVWDAYIKDRKGEIKEPKEWVTSAPIFASLLGGIATIIALVAMFCAFGDLSGYLNPEYYAIQHILSALK